MPHFSLFLADEAATAALGRTLGQLAHNQDIILLYGDLGVGKTTLTQALARGLEVPEAYYVSSPSFALLHEYPGRFPLVHIDCYRLADEEELEDAGLLEYMGSKGVTVVEWPERLGRLCPRERLDIMLEWAGAEARQCHMQAHGSAWLERLQALFPRQTGDHGA
jgi:tRNA threonylcarbamoyladenosine biosynthesis protein TsaE